MLDDNGRTFGRGPLFFYLLNFPVAFWIGTTIAALTGQDYRHFFSPIGPFEGSPAGFGHGLGMTYLAWFYRVADSAAVLRVVCGTEGTE
jgi:hypothetical protein